MEHSLDALILSLGTQEKLLVLGNEQGDLGLRTDQEAQPRHCLKCPGK